MQVMGGASQTNDRESLRPREEGVAVGMATCPPSNPVLETKPTAPVAPPPPPPMPPLLPVFGDLAEGLRKKRVRSFFWRTIPEGQVKGRSNLWTQDQEHRGYQIDVSAVEELFGQSGCQSNIKTTPTRTGTNRRSFRETQEEVSILDSKRGMNIGIFLKQFRRTNQLIIDDICHGNSRPYGAEPLRELLKLLPEPEEVRKLKSYQGDVAQLSLADSFMYLLVQLPSSRLRIQAMLLREELPVLSDAMRRDIATLRTAAKELRSCEELHQVLHLVLQAGNILNAGRHTGQAVGFKLSSLLCLTDTKANKPGMSLLHFVVLEAQKKDERLLEFPLKLSQVASAARISMETLDADLKSLRSRMISLEENVRKEVELLEQLDDFLQAAASCLGAVLECWRQLQEEGGELIDFFCEDQETFRLDDCFSIFNTFCCRFTAAIKENQEREVKEAKEAAHRRRLQELEEHKRHSWAGGEQVGGALGSRCSSERDVSSALPRQDRAALLVELLTTKPRPRGCSGRRSRIFPSSSPSNATGCQQDPLLGTTPPAHKIPPHRGPETPSDPPSASCLLQSHDISLATQVDATSDINQQSDHHNNAGAERGDSEALSDRQVQSDSGPEKTGTREVDPDLKERGNLERFEDLVPARLSVVVEKCTLVPRLKVFDGVLHTSSVRGHHQGDVDLEDDPLDPEKGQRSSPPQEGEEGEGKVNVWCVTGVCEAAGELSDSIHVGTKKNQPSSNNQGDPTSSSVPANHSPSAPQPANEKPAPLPISSQPAPVLNHLSSSRWRPVDWVSTGADPEEAVVPTNQRKETAGDQSTNDRSRTKTSCPLTNERTGAASKLSSRNLLPCKTHTATAKTPSKPRSVRTLTQTEHQGMRRLLPISRTGLGASLVDKHPEQGQQSSSGAEANLPRGARPATAPSSRRSSVTKNLDRRSSKDQKVTQDQNQDSKTKVAAGKAVMKPRVQLEEKMCRSTLRALGGGAGGGGAGGEGGSSSAPTTPTRNAPPVTPLPSFAQSTASSSFRRSTLAPPSSSLKASLGSSSSLNRAGSPRVTNSSSSHSSLLLRSPSIRAPPRSALQDPLAAPKGHWGNSSRTFPDKPSVRDSVRNTRPVWR